MMPAHDAEQFIAQAIESALSQRFTDWELIVVDDGSVDGTGAIVGRYSADERIRLIRQPNQGEAAARNTALSYMRGEFVAFLDADDQYLPEHLEACVGHLRSCPENAGVYTDGYYVTASGQRIKRLSERRRRPLTGRLFDEILRGSDLLEPPVSVVLRRRTIEQSRLRFDETIVIGPDWDFFLKFADVGAFGYVDRPTCLYRVHDSNISRRIDVRRRRLDRAKCRLNAIGMAGFERCPLDVRVSVFHDLLIEALRDEPDRQREVVTSSPFAAIPAHERARLLRLMGSAAILHGGAAGTSQEWIRRSLELDRRDVRGWLVGGLLWLSPELCRLALRMRRVQQRDAMVVDPLADVTNNLHVA